MKHLLLTTIAAVALVGCGNPEADRALLDASEKENIEAVKQHLDTGADVNAKDEGGQTPLHRAALRGHKEIVELLIAKSADVNAKDLNWRTPLHYATFGSDEIVELLLANGADVNPKDRGGQTPLDLAIQQKKPETAALLRKHEGKSGANDSIHIATSIGNIEAVKQHIAGGSNVNAMDKYGWTPLHEAARFGQKEVSELLITNGADLNARNDDGVTPLDNAIMHKQTEITDLLRQHGGKTGDWLNADDSIHNAASAGHIEAVKQHLAAGADVNAEHSVGWTPLHLAAIYDHKETAELIIANGADVNAKNDGGFTPLHAAALNGHKEIAELLIEKGANLNAKDRGRVPAEDTGKTPLHLAAKKGHKEIAELLITKGADVNAKDEDGGTPLDVAIKYKQTETVDLLRKHGGKTGEELKAEGK